MGTSTGDLLLLLETEVKLYADGGDGLANP
jgi:hypothetical protein